MNLLVVKLILNIEEYEDALFEKYALDEDLDTKVEEVEKTEENEDAEEEQEEEKEQISFFNKETEIKLSDAKKIDKTLEVGDTIDTEVTPKEAHPLRYFLTSSS